MKLLHRICSLIASAFVFFCCTGSDLYDTNKEEFIDFDGGLRYRYEDYISCKSTWRRDIDGDGVVNTNDPAPFNRNIPVATIIIDKGNPYYITLGNNNDSLRKFRYIVLCEKELELKPLNPRYLQAQAKTTAPYKIDFQIVDASYDSGIRPSSPSFNIYHESSVFNSSIINPSLTLDCLYINNNVVELSIPSYFVGILALLYSSLMELSFDQIQNKIEKHFGYSFQNAFSLIFYDIKEKLLGEELYTSTSDVFYKEFLAHQKVLKMICEQFKYDFFIGSRILSSSQISLIERPSIGIKGKKFVYRFRENGFNKYPSDVYAISVRLDEVRDLVRRQGLPGFFYGNKISNLANVIQFEEKLTDLIRVNKVNVEEKENCIEVDLSSTGNDMQTEIMDYNSEEKKWFHYFKNGLLLLFCFDTIPKTFYLDNVKIFEDYEHGREMFPTRIFIANTNGIPGYYSEKYEVKKEEGESVPKLRFPYFFRNDIYLLFVRGLEFKSLESSLFDIENREDCIFKISPKGTFCPNPNSPTNYITIKRTKPWDYCYSKNAEIKVAIEYMFPKITLNEIQSPKVFMESSTVVDVQCDVSNTFGRSFIYEWNVTPNNGVVIPSGNDSSKAIVFSEAGLFDISCKLKDSQNGMTLASINKKVRLVKVDSFALIDRNNLQNKIPNNYDFSHSTTTFNVIFNGTSYSINKNNLIIITAPPNIDDNLEYRFIPEIQDNLIEILAEKENVGYIEKKFINQGKALFRIETDDNLHIPDTKWIFGIDDPLNPYTEYTIGSVIIISEKDFMLSRSILKNGADGMTIPRPLTSTILYILLDEKGEILPSQQFSKFEVTSFNLDQTMFNSSVKYYERLTHKIGLKFDSSKNATIYLYTWNSNTAPALLLSDIIIQDLLPVRVSFGNHFEQIRSMNEDEVVNLKLADLDENILTAGDSSKSIEFEFGKEYGDPSGNDTSFDLRTSIARAHIKGNIQLTIGDNSTSPPNSICFKKIVLNLEINDLIDYDYLARELTSQNAVKLQAGFGIFNDGYISEAGNVFIVKFIINKVFNGGNYVINKIIAVQNKRL